MTNHTRMTIRLGDLVVATFDEASTHSADPHEVSLLATQAVTHLLRGASRAKAPPRASLPQARVAGS